MDIILDPLFFNVLINTVNTETDIYRDFETFIRRVKPEHLFVKCSTDEDFYEMVIENPFLELIINDSPITLTCQDSLLENINLWSFYEKGSCFKVFLISGSSEICSSLSRQFGYEFISPENFDQIWSNYLRNRSDLARKVTTRTTIDEANRFNSWDCLDSFVHPVNSILINDSYILNDQPNQKIKDNLLPLLKKLLRKRSESLPVEIIIFADPAPARQLDYKKIHALLSAELDQVLGPNRYHLNLVRYSKHKRFILTNYLLIRCENSFNFFKQGGQLFSDTPWIDFEFLFSPWDQRLSDDLEELNDKLRKLENSRPDATFEVINFYPGKTNRIFNTNH